MHGRWLTSLLSTLLMGCNDLEVCGSHQEQVLGLDGGMYRCTLPEDCPRSSRVFVCTSDVTPEQECVTCQENTCVRIIPEPCP